jgi:hypothetical protein
MSILALGFVVLLSTGLCGHSSGHESGTNVSRAHIAHFPKLKDTSAASVQQLLTTSVPPANNNESDGQLNEADYNITVDSTDVDEAFERFLSVKIYLDPAVMSIIFIFGSVTNVTLLVIFARHEDMRTSTNACIFTMAIGDLLSIVFNIPLFYVLLVSKRWTVGVALCKLLWFFSDFAVGLSIFAVTMLSVQRYCGIVNTNVYIYNGRLALRSRLVSGFNIFLIWILAFGFAVRTAVTANVTNEKCYSSAGSYSPEFSKNIALLNLFVFCIIPLAVIAVFYVLTACHLIASARDMPGEASISHSKIIQARKKGAKTVLGLTGVFFVSYVPWYLWQVVFFWGGFSSDYKITTYTYTFLYYLFFGTLCFNPIALYCVSSTFRRYFNQYLFCNCKFNTKRVDENLTSVKGKSNFYTSSTNITAQ